jgi:hypothetical protein
MDLSYCGLSLSLKVNVFSLFGCAMIEYKATGSDSTIHTREARMAPVHTVRGTPHLIAR